MPHPRIGQQVTFLYTDDLETASVFYEETLGLELVLDQGPCRLFRIGPDSFVGICNRNDRPRGTDGVVVTFVVDSVDTWCAHLTEKGVAIERPAEYSETYKVYSAFFRDPAGYLLEVQEFRGTATAPYL